MNISDVSPGHNVPNDINVIIEIPAHSDAVKYEVDKATGALIVDRFMVTAMVYPGNYGYVPQTLSEDGDPVDVIVMTPAPLISGAIINCRPVGMLEMEDESGPDAKILAVPSDKLSKLYRDIHEPQDVQPHILDVIKHFFSHYKDLEEEKWVKVAGWKNTDTSKKEIVSSMERFKQYQLK